MGRHFSGKAKGGAKTQSHAADQYKLQAENLQMKWLAFF
jgi:hypothetical protein